MYLGVPARESRFSDPGSLHANPGAFFCCGATAHYVTDNLDEGPIIAQDVIGCNHRDTVDDLMRKGKEVERRVLAEAVRLYTEDRVLIYQNKTIVFEG